MTASATADGMSPRMKLTKKDQDALEPQREVLEVEVERLGVRPSRWEVIRGRFVNVLKPVVLGGLVDFGDLITSPILAPVFLPLGMLVGYLFAKWLEAPPTWRLCIAAMVGVYWIVPFTSPVPVAALTAGFVTIFRPDVMKHDPLSQGE